MEATGINLSAFGATRRPLVAAATDTADGVHVQIAPARAFGSTKLSDRVDDTFAGWRASLLEMAAPIGVDVALDVSGLVSPMGEPGSRQLWELTHRPLDFAFYGAAPLTDKIGEFGHRFRAMLGLSEFGGKLIEVSPLATVELLGFKGQYVGGGAHHGHSGWKADDKGKRGDKLMAKLLSELGVNPLPGAEKFGSDELDAMLCALTALAVARGDAVVKGKELDADVSERCARRAIAEPNPAHKAPANSAVLAEPFWATLNVSAKA